MKDFFTGYSKYAEVLQCKRELQDAEKYFHRATQADPNDGEILIHYAKLEWESHHDRDRALVKFEKCEKWRALIPWRTPFKNQMCPAT